MKTAKGISVLIVLMLSAATAFADWGQKSFHEHSYGPQNRYKGHDYDGNRYGSYRREYLPQHRYGFSRMPARRASPADWIIQNGIRTGRLSQREVNELREEQRDIRRESLAYRADGVLSSRERNEIYSDISDFRKKLDHELNDGERRRRW